MESDISFLTELQQDGNRECIFLFILLNYLTQNSYIEWEVGFRTVQDKGSITRTVIAQNCIFENVELNIKFKIGLKAMQPWKFQALDRIGIDKTLLGENRFVSKL